MSTETVPELVAPHQQKSILVKVEGGCETDTPTFFENPWFFA